MKLLLSLIVLLLGASILAAQTAPPAKTIAGGVLNGKAISLPKAVYPKDATKIGGRVRVSIVIDETGKVVSARTLDGIENPAFRQAAEAAALKAVFQPTTLEGKPAKVSGVIEYDFVPESGYEEQLKPMAIGLILSLTRHSASDIGAVNRNMDSSDILKEIADDVPAFAKEIPNSAFLEKLSVAERREVIERAHVAVQNASSKSDRWQLDVGKSLGDLIGPLFLQMSSGKDFDPTKLSESVMRVDLARLKLLSDSPPEGFPNEILVKLKAVGALSSREGSLVEPRALQSFMVAVMDLVETISPDN